MYIALSILWLKQTRKKEITNAHTTSRNIIVIPHPAPYYMNFPCWVISFLWYFRYKQEKIYYVIYGYSSIYTRQVFSVEIRIQSSRCSAKLFLPYIELNIHIYIYIWYDEKHFQTKSFVPWKIQCTKIYWRRYYISCARGYKMKNRKISTVNAEGRKEIHFSYVYVK